MATRRSKKKDVEVLGGVAVETAVVDEGTAKTEKKKRGARGPKSGEDAPLFGSFAAPDAEFGIDKGELTISFDAERPEWSLQKDQSIFAADIAAAYVRQLPSVRRTEADLSVSDDDGSEIRRVRGMIVITFTKPLKVWRMAKALAVRKIGHLRVEARGLPKLKES